MRYRKIAVLIDGGIFIKRLPKLVSGLPQDASAIANQARFLCKRHVVRLTGEPFNNGRWLDHVYRLFYYDASPYDGEAHHPLTNRSIDFNRTPEAKFRRDLFNEIRRLRKFALRLGKVSKDSDWQIANSHLVKKILRTGNFLNVLDAAASGAAQPELTDTQKQDLARLVQVWQSLTPDDVRLGLRQKGVDMRIGIDITTLTLKKQVDTIILVTGDSDFVPAAKLARREGVEFLLDPLWQKVNDDLYEHVDGIVSAFPRPGSAAYTEGIDTESDEGRIAEPTDATYSADEE